MKGSFISGYRKVFFLTDDEYNRNSGNSEVVNNLVGFQFINKGNVGTSKTT